MHGLKPMHLDSKSECTGYCKRCMVFCFWPVKISLDCNDWPIFAGRRGFAPRNENEKLKEVPLADLFAFPICVSYT